MSKIQEIDGPIINIMEPPPLPVPYPMGHKEADIDLEDFMAGLARLRRLGE